MTFQKPVGDANPYVRFWYGQLTIFLHNQGNVSGSMNDNKVDANKLLNNQQQKYD